jgi:hypothetical protein
MLTLLTLPAFAQLRDDPRFDNFRANLPGSR